jgi:hypothetical protein
MAETPHDYNAWSAKDSTRLSVWIPGPLILGCVDICENLVETPRFPFVLSLSKDPNVPSFAMRQLQPNSVRQNVNTA